MCVLTVFLSRTYDLVNYLPRDFSFHHPHELLSRDSRLGMGPVDVRVLDLVAPEHGNRKGRPDERPLLFIANYLFALSV